MGESRSDLLIWLNDLLQLNLTKIESLGSGSTYCQVIDSIYGDVALQRVKFQAKQEYEYMANFKVLQDAFKKHKIDKVIPVEGLMKCKMQDNLEFCQWLKRFWESNWPGGDYDAIGRRGGQGGVARGTTPSSVSSASSRPQAASRAPATSTGARRAPIASTSSSSTASRRPLANSGGGTTARLPPSARSQQQQQVPDEALQALTAQMGEMRVSVEALEKERDFYFGKLREIEIIVAARLEEPEEGESEMEVLKKVQEILYQTEEGFEVPEENGEGLVDEEETF